MSKFRIGVVGAKGVLGEEILRTFVLREFPVASFRLFEPEDHLGEKLEVENPETGEEDIPVSVLSDSALDDLDIVVFAAGPDITRQWGGLAAQLGLKILDLSDPPVRGGTRVASLEKSVLAEGPLRIPCSSATILSMAISPILRQGVRVERMRIVGLLSASEAGRRGIETLSKETRDLLNFQVADEYPFDSRIAFNIIPGCVVDADHENRTSAELAELLEVEPARVSVMLASAPVFFGNTYAVELDTIPRLSPERIRQILAEESTIELSGNGPGNDVPPQISAFAGTDEIGVGRIRSSPSGVQFWVAADNVRAVARNAVQLLELALGLESPQ